MGTKSKQLHIVGSLSNEEATQVATLFEAETYKRIDPGDKRALEAAANRPDRVLLMERGQHHFAVLNLRGCEWFTFEREGRHIVVQRKIVGMAHFERVFALSSVPAVDRPSP